MATGIKPRTDNADTLGLAAKRYARAYVIDLHDGTNTATIAALAGAVTNSHTAVTLGTKEVDETDIGDQKALVFDQASGKIKYITISSGVTAFTGLSDVPNAYTGESLKLARVKSDETGLEFFTLAVRAFEYDASHVMTLEQLGKFIGEATIRSYGAPTTTFTLPSVTSAERGYAITIIKASAAELIVQAADSDTIADSGAAGTIHNATAGETWATLTLVFDGATNWVVAGATGTWVTTDTGVDKTTFRYGIGGGGGYTNLTEFVDQTAWRLFYSDGSGDVQELALGSLGTVLTGGGTTAAPTWETPTGGVSSLDLPPIQAGSFGYPASNFAPMDEVINTYTTIQRQRFDDTTEEFVLFYLDLPATLAAGTVTLTAKGRAVTAAADKNIQLKFYHHPIGDSGAEDAAFATLVSGDLACDATQGDLDIFTFGDTVANLGWAASNRVYCKLSRIAPSGTNLTGDWGLESLTVTVPVG